MEKLYQLFYETSGVCTDTRAITPNCLFIALKGENFNGNDFAAKAIEQGAKFALVDEREKADEKSIFYVPDCLLYLQKLARYHRNKFSIPIIGITGSNGKTTSKELIAHVLMQKYRVHYTKGNLNNHIGVPLTLLQLNEQHEIAVIEMGANKPGDIEELCAIAEPNYGIITNVGSAHLEGFGSIEGVIQTKTALYRSLKKNKGTVIANADDEIICAQVPKELDTYYYSHEKATFIQGELKRQNPFVQFNWKFKNYQSPEVTSHLIGKYNFYNFLAAIVFGKLFEVSNEDINRAIENYQPSNNRSQIEKTQGNTLIVDCYNANPTSMKAALESFDLVEADDKMVILGDMLELGTYSQSEHRKIIEYLSDKPWKVLFVGAIFKQFETFKGLLFFENVEDLNRYLQEENFEKKMILIKGSRGIKLEKAIPFL